MILLMMSEEKDQSDRSLAHMDNMSVAMCTCPIGFNGAPCKHQYVCMTHFGIHTHNFSTHERWYMWAVCYRVQLRNGTFKEFQEDYKSRAKQSEEQTKNQTRSNKELDGSREDILYDHICIMIIET